MEGEEVKNPTIKNGRMAELNVRRHMTNEKTQ